MEATDKKKPKKTRKARAGKKVSVTISIGVAAYPVNGETMENVITAADNAVYASKEEGGNRVSMAGEFITSDEASSRIVRSIRGESSSDGG